MYRAPKLMHSCSCSHQPSAKKDWPLAFAKRGSELKEAKHRSCCLPAALARIPLLSTNSSLEIHFFSLDRTDVPRTSAAAQQIRAPQPATTKTGCIQDGTCNLQPDVVQFFAGHPHDSLSPLALDQANPTLSQLENASNEAS